MAKVELAGKYVIVSQHVGFIAWVVSLERAPIAVGDVRYIEGVLMYAEDAYCVSWRTYRVYWAPVDPAADRNAWLNSTILKV